MHSRRFEDDDASKVFLIRIIELIVIGGHFSSSRGKVYGPKSYYVPVSVAKSMIVSTPSLSAYTSASARVSLPSASVLRTSIVLPFEATKMSPGLMASAEIIFSHTAVMKWTSTF